MTFLERNLQQLTNVQKQLVEQNTTLKKDISVADRKLTARNERIQGLEVQLRDTQVKLDAHILQSEEQVQGLQDKIQELLSKEDKRGKACEIQFLICLPYRIIVADNSFVAYCQ